MQEQAVTVAHGWVRVSKIVQEYYGETGLRLGRLHVDPTCCYLTDRADSGGNDRTMVIPVSGPIMAQLPMCKRCAGQVNRPKGEQVKFEFNQRSLEAVPRQGMLLIAAGNRTIAIPGAAQEEADRA